MIAEIADQAAGGRRQAPGDARPLRLRCPDCGQESPAEHCEPMSLGEWQEAGT